MKGIEMKVILPARYNVIEMFAKDGGYLTGHYLGKLCYYKEAEAIIKNLTTALEESRREASKLRKALAKCSKEKIVTQ